MKDILNKFSAVAQNPAESLKEYKKTNDRPVIGCFPMHVPEELVHAAGVLPIVFWQTNDLATGGFDYIQQFFCGIARTTLDRAFRGQFDFLDGVIFPENLCLSVRGLAASMKRNFKSSYFGYISLPVVLSEPFSKKYAIEELEKLKGGLEEYTGTQITEDSLNSSIAIYNENRFLLRKFYQLRTSNPGLLKTKDVMVVVRAGMLMPREEHSRLLGQLIGELERIEPVASNSVRLMLSGSLCEAPPDEILDLIEESGAVIVDDDLYTGSRHFATDVSSHGNPIEALAESYIHMVAPCPTKIGPDSNWGDYIVDRARKSHSDGVVFIIVKYCEPHFFQHSDICETLAEAAIPSLMLETEQGMLSLSQVKTRIQAFLEVLEGK